MCLTFCLKQAFLLKRRMTKSSVRIPFDENSVTGQLTFLSKLKLYYTLLRSSQMDYWNCCLLHYLIKIHLATVGRLSRKYTDASKKDISFQYLVWSSEKSFFSK